MKFDEAMFPFQELLGEASCKVMPFNEEEILGRVPLIVRIRNPDVVARSSTHTVGVEAVCAFVTSLGNSFTEQESLSTLDLEPNPSTYDKALGSRNCEKWKRATFEELDSFLVNEVFEIVDSVPSGQRPISTRWVYNRKFDEKGFLSKFKG